MKNIQELKEKLAETRRKLDAVEKRTKKLEKILHPKGIPEKQDTLSYNYSIKRTIFLD